MRTLFALALLFPVATHAAETIGRLFFTPEQRAQLDTMRIKKIVASQVKDDPTPEFVSYSGIVRQNDGKITVWINSKALSEIDLQNQQAMKGRISRDGRITMEGLASQGSQKVQLKVGQTAELLSGKIVETHTKSTTKSEQTQKSESRSASTSEAEGDKQASEKVRGANQKNAAPPHPPH